MNDEQRKEWVMNDEGLYNLYRSTRLKIRQWVQENRALIDTVINNVTSGSKPAHYLKFGV